MYTISSQVKSTPLKVEVPFPREESISAQISTQTCVLTLMMLV